MEELQEAWSPSAVPEPLLDPTLVTECLCFFFMSRTLTCFPLSPLTSLLHVSCLPVTGDQNSSSVTLSVSLILSPAPQWFPERLLIAPHRKGKATKLTNQKYLFFQEMIKVPALMVMGLVPNITNPLPAFSSTEPSFAVPIEWVESSTLLPSSSVRSPPVQQVLQVVMDINRLATID